MCTLSHWWQEKEEAAKKVAGLQDHSLPPTAEGRESGGGADVPCPDLLLGQQHMHLDRYLSWGHSQCGLLVKARHH